MVKNIKDVDIQIDDNARKSKIMLSSIDVILVSMVV